MSQFYNECTTKAVLLVLKSLFRHFSRLSFFYSPSDLQLVLGQFLHSLSHLIHCLMYNQKLHIMTPRLELSTLRLEVREHPTELQRHRYKLCNITATIAALLLLLLLFIFCTVENVTNGTYSFKYHHATFHSL